MFDFLLSSPLWLAPASNCGLVDICNLRNINRNSDLEINKVNINPNKFQSGCQNRSYISLEFGSPMERNEQDND
jgi:hypothetical protein